MTYQLAFVDSIVTSPTTRLDLNGGSWSLQADGTAFPPPPLRRAVVSTLLADGERIPAAAYANRTITLRLYCTEATDDLCATAVQNLGRELDRSQNFLRYQVDTTNPVFFRTFRSDLTAIDWDPFTKFATVTIPAEPFAYGPVESLGSTTVNNDPAAVSNGCYLDISGVKGDVETPLIVSLASTDATFKPTSLFAVRRRGTPSQMPFLLQAESMSRFNDTTLPGNDPAMSGSGSNYARCSFTTVPTLGERLANSATPALPADARGTYRVFARLRTTVGTDTISVQLGWGGNIVFNDAVTINSASGSAYGPFYFDLGLIQIPVGPDPVHDGYSGVELAVDDVNIQLWATRSSGTGSLDIDHLLFAPADDRLLLVKWPNPGTTAYTWVLDGAHEMVITKDGGGAINSSTVAQLSGGMPMISPGVTNRLVFVRSVGVAGGSSPVDAITNTVALTCSYYPRYLYVRPATT